MFEFKSCNKILQFEEGVRLKSLYIWLEFWQFIDVIDIYGVFLYQKFIKSVQNSFSDFLLFDLSL
jgi:hypothetical protein